MPPISDAILTVAHMGVLCYCTYMVGKTKGYMEADRYHIEDRKNDFKFWAKYAQGEIKVAPLIPCVQNDQ